MTRSNRLEESRHNNPRSHEAREFDIRADDTRAEWVEPEWDIEGYDASKTTGKLRLPAGLEEDGMTFHAARFMRRGEFDPRSEQLQEVKGYRRPNPAKLKNRPMRNPQDIDAPFQIKINDVEILYRPKALRDKDDKWRREAAAYQVRNAEGVIENMSMKQIHNEYGASEY